MTFHNLPTFPETLKAPGEDWGPWGNNYDVITVGRRVQVAPRFMIKTKTSMPGGFGHLWTHQRFAKYSESLGTVPFSCSKFNSSPRGILRMILGDFWLYGFVQDIVAPYEMRGKIFSEPDNGFSSSISSSALKYRNDRLQICLSRD